jgi:sigma-E factor negative regulatory protein RseB
VTVAIDHGRRALTRLGLRAGLGLGLLGAGVQAASQIGHAAAVSAPLSAADGKYWLARIQQAAANTSYQGTLVFSAAGAVSSSRVTHICDGRQRYERIEVLDGRARVQYRHNEQALTVWPASKLARVEQRDLVAEFPALPAAPQSVLDYYDMGLLARDRIAGREAEVLMLKPRDKLRFAQRLWVDRDTGLLGKWSAESVLGPMKRLEGFRVLRPQVERTQPDNEGWVLARPVLGFVLVACSKRSMDMAADADTPAGGSTAGPVQVLQSVFSDGLAHVSVFIEPFDASRHKQPMGTSLGATHTMTHRQGDWWLTVVGEVPMSTVQLFEASFERKR